MCLLLSVVLASPYVAFASTNDTVKSDLATIVVEATALSKYRPETVNAGTFTDIAPEKLPCVVDTLTEDFIREEYLF